MPAPRRSRRLLAAAAVAALGVAIGAVLLTRGPDEPVIVDGPVPTAPEVVPYDPAMLIRRPIPDGAALDPRSDAVVGRLVSNAAERRFQIATGDETPPVYRVGGNDPFLRVRVGGRDVRFRVPRGATVGGGSDHPLVLLDRRHPDLGSFVELRLFRAEIDRGAGVLRAEGAGLFHYNNDGRRLNPDRSRSIAEPFLGDGTGSGLSIMAGLVRPEEIAAGRIDHAVRFGYSSIDSVGGFRAPAIKTDQPKGGVTRNPADAMQMGMRLQLDPAVDCEKRTVPGHSGRSRETRFLRILCHAMQRYGMVMLDGTFDGGLIIGLEDDATAGWDRVIGEQREGSYGYIIRSRGSAADGLNRGDSSGIPWDRMRVLAP